MTQSSRVLATRCPHCHTVFRVVADQLKLRDGLVRCGHCREVFDGRAYLCEPPADDNEASTDAATSAVTNTSGVATSGDATAASQTADDVTHRATAAASSTSSTSAATDDKRIPEMLTPTAIAALLGSPDESRAQMQHGPGRYMDDDPTALPAPTASPPRADASASPAAAQQDKRPGAARVVWRVLMTLAVVGLIGQWAWIERAALVDRVPALRGAFAAVGRPLHVTIAQPRQPDMIQISSVTLVTDEPGAGDDANSASAPPAAPAADTVPMTLTVFIRNQAGHAVAWPSLELTLSDIDGKPVVRRVFSANEYIADATMRDAGLTPRNERTIRLRLSAQAALASNYRVLAFYP